MFLTHNKKFSLIKCQPIFQSECYLNPFLKKTECVAVFWFFNSSPFRKEAAAERVSGLSYFPFEVFFYFSLEIFQIRFSWRLSFGFWPCHAYFQA